MDRKVNFPTLRGPYEGDRSVRKIRDELIQTQRLWIPSRPSISSILRRRRRRRSSSGIRSQPRLVGSWPTLLPLLSRSHNLAIASLDGRVCS